MTSKEEYALLDKLGICHECKKAKQFPGRKYCPACLADKPLKPWKFGGQKA